MEQRKAMEAASEVKKLQRQLAELRASSQSDHKLVVEYTETINSLEIKIVNIRQQLEHSVCTCCHYDEIYVLQLVNELALLVSDILIRIHNCNSNNCSSSKR